MAGVSFQVANTFTMDLYYRYFNGGDIRSARGTGTLNGSSGAYSGVSGDLRAHEVGLSLRVPIMP
jgi:opacity protein-like surface antigen